MLGMRGEKGKQLQVGMREEEGALQSGDELLQIPGPAVLASEVGLLPGQEGQRCTTWFRLRRQKTSGEKSLVG